MESYEFEVKVSKTDISDSHEHQFSLIQKRAEKLDSLSKGLFTRCSQVFMDMLEAKHTRKRTKTEFETARLNLQKADDNYR